MKGTIIAAACGVLLLGARSTASADEVFLLGGNQKANEQGSVQNLTFDGDADTELVWRRGWGGGWRGGWGGGWRGGWGGWRGGWGGWRGGWGGYRGFAYRPWGWGGWGYGVGVPYYYGGGWGGGYYYAPSFYYGCADAPSVVYSLDLNGNGNGTPVMPPANGNGTYPYNGDPQAPATQPLPPSIPAGQPRPTLPLKGQFVTLPKDTFLAYGEKAAPSAPAKTTTPTAPQRYTYQAYGESRPAPAQKTYRVSQNRP